MRNQRLIVTFFAAVFIFVSSSLFSQNVGKVKAIMGNLPESMETGSTHKIAVNITNTGTTEWSSEHLHGKEHGKFEVTKEWSGEWKLQPGETTQVYYKVTAPSEPGSYKLWVSIYNDNKRIATGSRKVEVVSITSPGNK